MPTRSACPIEPVVTNAADYAAVVPIAEGQVNARELVLDVVGS